MNICHYSARDGKRLMYRWFESAGSQLTLICLHGSTFDSLRYAMLARVLAMRGVHVCLPDWRGHGDSEGTPGDIDYETQLQDDLADLIAHLKKQGRKAFVVGGHSAGAVIALRFCALYNLPEVQGYFAIAPPFTQTDETRKFDYSGGAFEYRIRYGRAKRHWRLPDDSTLQYTPKLNGIAYTLAKCLPFLRSMKVMRFPMVGEPKHNANRVLAYSYRLLSAYSIQQYPKLLEALTVPVCVVVGDDDEVVEADTLESLINWYIGPSVPVEYTVVSNSKHMTVVNPAAAILANWLREQLFDRWGAVA